MGFFFQTPGGIGGTGCGCCGCTGTKVTVSGVKYVASGSYVVAQDVAFNNFSIYLPSGSTGGTCYLTPISLNVGGYIQFPTFSAFGSSGTGCAISHMFTNPSVNQSGGTWDNTITVPTTGYAGYGGTVTVTPNATVPPINIFSYLNISNLTPLIDDSGNAFGSSSYTAWDGNIPQNAVSGSSPCQQPDGLVGSQNLNGKNVGSAAFQPFGETDAGVGGTIIGSNGFFIRVQNGSMFGEYATYYCAGYAGGTAYAISPNTSPQSFVCSVS